MLDVCWTFAGSCKHPITYTPTTEKDTIIIDVAFCQVGAGRAIVIVLVSTYVIRANRCHQVCCYTNTR